jgi:hypothetical protein
LDINTILAHIPTHTCSPYAALFFAFCFHLPLSLWLLPMLQLSLALALTGMKRNVQQHLRN